MIQLKRVYEAQSSEDGFCVLVDRLWPRGISKEKLSDVLWLKEVAPSTELRKWFAHDPEKWPAFQKKYQEELQSNAAFLELKALAAAHRNICLLYAARDEVHNEAQVLATLLKKVLKKA
ncbi:MAG: DUF488 family protein [Bacteroidetes bacterium]|nr:DUF488 family protein [Bacteroidota bacterium]MBS1630517.1 DUF488 family protein [Bacteroidota bacterium]